MVAIISFSFVNTDLRDTFRLRFPNAIWALVDTKESEAEERIRTREGHFYKGAPPSAKSGNEEYDVTNEEPDRDNSEWDFEPVTFSHSKLPGNEPIEENARTIVNIILREIYTMRK
jgi:hypothetical protein